MLTAVEFAEGKGHPDHPLLRKDQAPASRVPCVDFSPWLRDRLVENDRAATVAYLLQMVQGSAIAPTAISSATAARSGVVDVDWATLQWTKIAVKLADVSFEDLLGPRTDVWELDLQTALTVMYPTQNPLAVFVQNPSNECARTLPAMMTAHDIRLRDPDKVVLEVNRQLSEWRRNSLWDRPDLLVEEVVPGRPDEIPAELLDLPLGSRSHLLDIASRNVVGPGFARRFSTFYRTRQIGCDDEQSLEHLMRADLLREVHDAEMSWRLGAQQLTVAELRDLLRNEGVPAPTKMSKARLVEASKAIREQVLSRIGPQRVFELTARGRHVVAWTEARSTATVGMWAAWGCRFDL